MCALCPRSFLRVAALLALALSLNGCAKVPNLTDTNTARRLLRVRFSLRAPVTAVNPETGRQNYYFIVVNLTDDPNAPGPVPQLFSPYSNGIAVAKIPGNVGMVGFVQYGGGLNNARLFRAPRDITITDRLAYQNAESTLYPDYQSQDRGLVDQQSIGGNTIDITFALNRLLLDPGTTGLAAPALPQYVQVNIITTDNVPSNSPNIHPKLWDALGDGRTTQNTYSLPLLTTQASQPLLSSDAGEANEPADSDVRDVQTGATVTSDTLDITDWLIQVR